VRTIVIASRRKVVMTLRASGGAMTSSRPCAASCQRSGASTARLDGSLNGLACMGSSAESRRACSPARGTIVITPTVGISGEPCITSAISPMSTYATFASATAGNVERCGLLLPRQARRAARAPARVSLRFAVAGTCRPMTIRSRSRGCCSRAAEARTTRSARGALRRQPRAALHDDASNVALELASDELVRAAVVHGESDRSCRLLCRAPPLPAPQSPMLRRGGVSSCSATAMRVGPTSRSPGKCDNRIRTHTSFSVPECCMQR
jgi:hypothetical protein